MPRPTLNPKWPKKDKEVPKTMHEKMSDLMPLHVRLRPSTFEEVIGQDAVTASLERLVKSNGVPHAFLFTGPSGVGKTTLARILASAVGVDVANVMEVDAATYSGAEDIRTITGMAQYQAFGESAKRMFIVDECHALSDKAWQALLKATEEPPPHAYWVFCTTVPEKVPRTVVTRCTHYDLKPVKKDLLYDYLELIAKQEELEVGDEVLGYIAQQAEGSVRQGLVLLSSARGLTSRKEAFELLNVVDETNAEAIELVRMLATGKGLSWANAVAIINKMENPNPEGIRRILLNYAGNWLLKTKGDKEATRLLQVLSCFSEPYRTGEGIAPLLLSIGALLYD